VRTLGLAEVIFAQRTSGREAFGIRLILAGAALAQRRMRLGGGALGGGKRNLAIGVLFWGGGRRNVGVSNAPQADVGQSRGRRKKQNARLE